jgi:hexokinase
MAGSKTDLPQNLIDQIRYLEGLFTVDTKKLKAISDHFVSELDKGLSVEGGSIVSTGKRVPEMY